MDTNKEEFSPQQSLRLISSMIETTKNAISDSSHYFLLWGWAVMASCMVQYYLKVIVNSPNHPMAWLITPVVLVVHIYFILRDRRRQKVKTFINEANTYLWTAVGLSFFALGFIFSKLGWQNCYPIYILLYGIGTYVSGRLIQFRPLFIGGLLCFPLAAITAYVNFDTEIIMLALAILISYIIPGHLLRNQYHQQKAINQITT